MYVWFIFMNALNLMTKPTAPKCYRRLNEKSKVKHSICIYDPNANTAIHQSVGFVYGYNRLQIFAEICPSQPCPNSTCSTRYCKYIIHGKHSVFFGGGENIRQNCQTIMTMTQSQLTQTKRTCHVFAHRFNVIDRSGPLGCYQKHHTLPRSFSNNILCEFSLEKQVMSLYFSKIWLNSKCLPSSPKQQTKQLIAHVRKYRNRHEN